MRHLLIISLLLIIAHGLVNADGSPKEAVSKKKLTDGVIRRRPGDRYRRRPHIHLFHRHHDHEDGDGKEEQKHDLNHDLVRLGQDLLFLGSGHHPGHVIEDLIHIGQDIVKSELSHDVVNLGQDLFFLGHGHHPGHILEDMRHIGHDLLHLGQQGPGLVQVKGAKHVTTIASSASLADKIEHSEIPIPLANSVNKVLENVVPASAKSKHVSSQEIPALLDSAHGNLLKQHRSSSQNILANEPILNALEDSDVKIVNHLVPQKLEVGLQNLSASIALADPLLVQPLSAPGLTSLDQPKIISFENIGSDTIEFNIGGYSNVMPSGELIQPLLNLEQNVIEDTLENPENIVDHGLEMNPAQKVGIPSELDIPIDQVHNEENKNFNIPSEEAGSREAVQNVLEATANPPTGNNDMKNLDTLIEHALELNPSESKPLELSSPLEQALEEVSSPLEEEISGNALLNLELSKILDLIKDDDLELALNNLKSVDFPAFIALNRQRSLESEINAALGEINNLTFTLNQFLSHVSKTKLTIYSPIIDKCYSMWQTAVTSIDRALFFAKLPRDILSSSHILSPTDLNSISLNQKMSHFQLGRATGQIQVLGDFVQSLNSMVAPETVGRDLVRHGFRSLEDLAIPFLAQRPLLIPTSSIPLQQPSLPFALQEQLNGLLTD